MGGWAGSRGPHLPQTLFVFLSAWCPCSPCPPCPLSARCKMQDARCSRQDIKYQVTSLVTCWWKQACKTALPHLCLLWFHLEALSLSLFLNLMIFSNAIVSVLHPDLLNSWVDSGHKWPFYQHLVLANQWVGGINLVGEYQHLLISYSQSLVACSCSTKSILDMMYNRKRTNRIFCVASG